MDEHVMTDSAAAHGEAAAAAEGWYPDTDPTMVRWWDGTSWTDQRQSAGGGLSHASSGQVAQLVGGGVVQPPTGYGLVPGTSGVRPLVPDSGGVHFLRHIGISLVVCLTTYVLIGLVWWMFILAQTGRRKRDILMFFIPIWGVVVAVQSMWRYTAKNVYWSARADRPSKSLFASS